MRTIANKDAYWAYVRSLNNEAKKEYAYSYYYWRVHGVQPTGDNDRGEPNRGTLSTMGAQAVRLAIDDLLREETK